jgi:hypothetical protein
VTKSRIDRREIELLRIVHPPQPFAELPSGCGLRASDRRDQLRIAADPSTVFRWSGAGAAQTDWKHDIPRKRDYAFDREVVEPVVPEVVRVLKPAALREGQLVQGECPGIWDRRVAIIGVWIFVSSPADLKLIQVIILPGHHRL